MGNNQLQRMLARVLASKASIQEILYQGNQHAGTESDYHVVFGVDADFVRHAGITIQSLIEHAGTVSVHFHIITAEDMAAHVDKLQMLITETAHSIHIHQFSDNLFTNLPSTVLFPKTIYYRLLAPHILEYEKTLLYLDADIVCINAFADFYTSITRSADIAFIVSENITLSRVLAQDIGLLGEKYFNSGMLLINVKRWLKENISVQALMLLEKKGQMFKYMDQDALNIILENKVRFVDNKYNTIFMLGHKAADYLRNPSDETIFLHYAGEDKPWQTWNKQSGASFYTDVFYKSPWASSPFDNPCNDQQAKKMYKLMFRERKYFSGFLWYFSYILFRYGK